MIDAITTMTADALDRLASQYKGKERVEALISAFTDNGQLIENVIQDFLEDRTVDTAVGDQLDIIGAIVGETRQGRGDDEYRLAILSRIAINTSEGTPEEIISFLQVFTGANDVYLYELFPGNVDVYVDVDLSSLFYSVDAVHSLIDKALSAGVRLNALGEQSGDEDFGFDGVIGALGFDDLTDPGNGGTFVSIASTGL